MKSGYVGFLMRLACGIIDAVCIGIIGGLLLLVFGRSVNLKMANKTFVVMNALLVLGWLYFAILESSKLRGTVGKSLLGVVVVDRNNEQIGFGRATGRYLGILLSGLLYGIGFLFPLWTKEKRALQDFIAATMLVYRGTENEELGIEAPFDVEDAMLAAKYSILDRMRDSGELDDKSYEEAVAKLRRSDFPGQG